MIEFIKKIPGLRSGIGRRFILYILLFSSVITFMGTGLQLYLDYDRDITLIHTSLKQVESSYLDSIANSLWITDHELLRIQLEGILRLPDMQFIEVRKGPEIIQAAGTPQSENIIEQTIPLVYAYNARDVHLGELHVVASLKGVYGRIFDRVLVILSIQAIKTFLVSMFIFIIFYLLVGRYVIYMASFVESMRFESIDQPLHLDRKPKKRKPDELDQLASAFNRMRENLTRDIVRRETVEKELRAGRAYLEELTNSMWDIVFSVRLPERMIEWVNDSIRLMGYEPSDCISKGTAFLYPDKDVFLDFGNKLKNATAAGNDLLHTEHVLKRKNGETFPAEFTITFHKENNEVVRITSIVRDISERKEAEAELEKHQKHLETLVNKQTTELEEKVTELERMNDVFVGREFRIKELRDRVKALEQKIDN
ncbi:MAG: PAS domain S-box protein [Nitrospina sp.]|nr:PAS domain S-box protein [Nitrospina sp.]